MASMSWHPVQASESYWNSLDWAVMWNRHYLKSWVITPVIVYKVRLSSSYTDPPCTYILLTFSIHLVQMHTTYVCTLFWLFSTRVCTGAGIWKPIHWLVHVKVFWLLRKNLCIWNILCVASSRTIQLPSICLTKSSSSSSKKEIVTYNSPSIIN